MQHGLTRSDISSYLLEDLSCLFNQLNIRLILLVKCQIISLEGGLGGDMIKLSVYKIMGWVRRVQRVESGTRLALSLLFNPLYANMNKRNFKRR
jgi:hypothetical protein